MSKSATKEKVIKKEASEIQNKQKR
jgi:hypothetical protein